MVPVESVLNAIAYARHDIAVDCAMALRVSKLTLQPTRLMITGLFNALFRAIYGISGEELEKQAEKMHDSPAHDTSRHFNMRHILRGNFGNFNVAQPRNPSAPTSQPSSVPKPHNPTLNKPHIPNPLAANANPLYAEVVTGKASADVSSPLSLTPFHHLQPPQHSVYEHLTIEGVIMPPPFILDPRSLPESIHFPAEVTEYLRSCLVMLCKGLITYFDKVKES